MPAYGRQLNVNTPRGVQAAFEYFRHVRTPAAGAAGAHTAMILFTDYNLLSACLFVLFFLWQSVRSRCFAWAAAAVLLWLAGTLALMLLLPGLAVGVSLFNLYAAHAYVFLGSLLFFARRVRALPDAEDGRRTVWQAAGVHGLMLQFAAAQLVQHLAFAMLCAMVWWQYPAGLTPRMVPRLISLYLLSPQAWYRETLLLTLLFYIHRRVWLPYGTNCLTPRQLYAGLLITLAAQFSFLLGINWPLFLRWLWLMLTS